MMKTYTFDDVYLIGINDSGDHHLFKSSIEPFVLDEEQKEVVLNISSQTVNEGSLKSLSIPIDKFTDSLQQATQWMKDIKKVPTLSYLTGLKDYILNFMIKEFDSFLVTHFQLNCKGISIDYENGNRVNIFKNIHTQVEGELSLTQSVALDSKETDTFYLEEVMEDYDYELEEGILYIYSQENGFFEVLVEDGCVVKFSKATEGLDQYKPMIQNITEEVFENEELLRSIISDIRNLESSKKNKIDIFSDIF